MKAIARARLALFAVGLLPAAWLVFAALTARLGAEPIEALAKETGEWTLRLLLLTLAVTPLRQLGGWPVLARFRRMLGLFTFFYACLHLTVYIALDLTFAWTEVWADLAERPFITVGMATFLVLLALAATSTRGWQRRLGRGWQRLHRLVYLAGAGAVLHFLWAVKADLREPLVYAALLLFLLGWRAMRHVVRRRARFSQ